MGVKQKSFPRYLFKFRACNDNTKRVFLNNELWFSNPLDFNDPFDCNIPIDSTFSNAQVEEWLRDSCGITDNIAIDKLIQALQKNPNVAVEQVKKAMQETGMCCFSADEYSILQWSHYANYHKGICLKFDITNDPAFFDNIQVVCYRNMMPHYNHITQHDKIVEYLIKPKFYQWSYENEVRIVKPKPLMDLNKNNRAFKFKEGTLVEMIFGANTTADDLNTYKDLCKKRNIPISKMELSTGATYGLEKRSW